MKDLELRFSNFEQAEDGNKLVGYAAKFNSLSEDLGGFVEKIAPGAFARSLRDNKDIRAFADHDQGKLLARSKNETLKLAEDDTGLRVEIKLPKTTLGNDIRELVREGTLSQMSFGFRVRKDSWQGNVRTLLDVDLFEVSVVSIPAYKNTEIALRSKAAQDEAVAKEIAAEHEKYEILLKALVSGEADQPNT